MLKAILHSFPIRLLQVHIKHNPFLLLYWLLLFSVVNGSFGEALGIPYLFLDPVYLDQVNFLGFMILGATLCGFAMAFNITGYILDSFRFKFLGKLSRPFTHYCLNNAIIPLAFLIFHAVRTYHFQTKVELNSVGHALEAIGGLLMGYVIMLTIFFFYFFITNRDENKQLARRKKRRERLLKQGKNPFDKKAQKERGRAFKKLRKLQRNEQQVGHYINLRLRVLPTTTEKADRLAILRVFMQNQRNAILIQLTILAVIFVLGAFQSTSVFQIPAAASMVVLLTVMVMITGALSFSLRSWLLTGGLAIAMLVNLFFISGLLTYEYPAYGLDYLGERKAYNLQTIRENASDEKIEASKQHMLSILENWKAQTGEEKPVMCLVSVSGGGQRSALWSLNVLQHADSVAEHQLFEKTTLITGASGGLFGAAYYRDLYMEKLDRNAPERLRQLSNEVLNPVIFTLVVNDLLLKVKQFEYGGQVYKRERGYEFEEHMKENLGGLLDRPLSHYRQPEASGQIPMLLVSPTITNDGRKLYISPQPTAFFNLGLNESGNKVQGVDFGSFLAAQQADSLRFLTALRMSATFPYVTPTISLPTNPPVQIADAGISDNYGISDAMIYLRVFQDWITENTSRVVVLAIRDSEKEREIDQTGNVNLIGKFFSPIQGVYRSWDQIQSIKNDQRFDLIKALYGDHLQRVNFAYIATGNEEFRTRASLSWRLTEREKKDVLEAIHNDANQAALQQLKELLKPASQE